MKKILILASVALMMSLSSCKKAGDVVCKRSILTIVNKITVSEYEYKDCTLRICSTYPLGNTTQAEKVEKLRYDGYKCR